MSGVYDLRKQFENQNIKVEIKPKTAISPIINLDTHNFLLLGESGVGKSTLINAFTNYLTYSTLEDAKNGELQILIGTSLLHTDNNGKFITIQSRDDDNEANILGESSTQRCKSYKFNLGNSTCIRLIDTPGISDTRGTTQDLINFENTMKIIDACGKITAFCIVMKCIQTRFNESFRQCLTQLFSQLHSNIKNNIIFIFTYGKGANYSAITAITLVNKFLRESKIGIQLNKQNVFCVENDTFNHLMITKRNLKSEILNCDKSWKESSKRYADFIRYVLKLEPQDVRATISINKTRQMLDKLTLALIDLTQHIGDNLNKIEERKKEVETSKTMLEFEKLKSSPDMKFETINLPKPKLICTSNKCTTFISVDSTLMKALFNKTCCPECGPLKHILSHGKFVKFSSRAMFSITYCSNCDCSERDHRIVYLETRIVENKEDIKIEDSDLKNEITLKKQLLFELENRYKTYVSERHSIIKGLTQFYYYLKENSMIEFSDFFKKVTKDKFKIFENQKEKRSDEFKNVLELYKSEKILLKKSLKSRELSIVTLQDLDNLKLFLCAMKYNGENITNIYRLLDSSFEGQEIDDEKCIYVPFQV